MNKLQGKGDKTPSPLTQLSGCATQARFCTRSDQHVILDLWAWWTMPTVDLVSGPDPKEMVGQTKRWPHLETRRAIGSARTLLQVWEPLPIGHPDCGLPSGLLTEGPLNNGTVHAFKTAEPSAPGRQSQTLQKPCSQHLFMSSLAQEPKVEIYKHSTLLSWVCITP